MIERSELEDILGPRVDEAPLGIVVGGSLSSGLQIKIDPRFSMEKLAVGRYVVIRGRQTSRRFFGIVTDIALDATNPDLVRRPPDLSEDFVLEVYSSEVAIGTLNVSLMLMLDEEQSEPRPVKTIPSHFSPTYEASAQDVE
ncbi:MAG: hypothetical protein KAT23_00920, partial [Anaerolineales bacterium]|nr:hypothetical protein [Anaerolineales bacterium]